MAPVAERTSMSLPAAKDLRAHADRIVERAKLSGTVRTRFLREQRTQLSERLLPTLAIIAVATGAAAGFDLLRDPPPVRAITLAQGLTAIVLAALALASTVARKSRVALMSLALAGGAVFTVGWGIVTAASGGVMSRYALAVPMGLTVLFMAIPLLPW